MQDQIIEMIIYSHHNLFMCSFYLFIPPITDYITAIQMSKDHMTQSEINRLIEQSQFDEQSVLKKPSQLKPAHQSEEENQYDDEEFENYEESRKTTEFQKSKKFQDKKPPNQNKLKQIKEENENVKQNNQKKESEKKIQKKAHTFNMKVNDNLPYNYARLQERERELLLTTLAEQNRNLKVQLEMKKNQNQKFEKKYNMLLTEKAEKNPGLREAQLEKQVVFLRRKVEKLQSREKIQSQKTRYKGSFKKGDAKLIPEQELKEREEQLLEIVDKLKNRLIESDEDMKILKNKLNEGIEHNDELVRKMRRVEKLEYQIGKLNQQVENDRIYIETLKEKLHETEKLYQNEKNQRIKLEARVKALQIGQLNQNDIAKELNETRKEKQLLQKSLKELSGNLMEKVLKGVHKNEQLDEENIFDVRTN